MGVLAYGYKRPSAMANRPISMNKIKQIIRLYCGGIGSKKSNQITGVSRNVVKTYVRAFRSLGLTLEQVEAMDDFALNALFHPPSEESRLPDIARYERLQKWLPQIAKALRRKGMTLERQWQWYQSQDSDGYGRTQFYNYLRDYRKRSGFTMHLEHKVGEKVFVDFCGDKLSIVEEHTGEVRDVEVFVAILGCSQLTYVQAVLSQKKEDFIACCAASFDYFGGVPKAIVPDNLKAAVTKSSKYEPILNETFETFAEHYGTVILPARSYKPKDKALVENAVKLMYQRIYACLEDGPFTSLQALNAAILQALEQHNNAPLKGGESRRTLYEQEERSAMGPLPQHPYELRRVREHKVMKNGHVALHEDRHYYSVPYEYIGKQVRLIYDSSTVEIYYLYKLIARHPRNYRRNRYSTQAEHLATKHRFLAEWSPEFFISRGQQIAPEVGLFMERLMEAKSHPEQGYKACSGVLNLAKRVGGERLRGACTRALEFKAYSYFILEDILKKGLDALPEQEESLSTTPVHPNLRGRDYYK